MDFTLHAGQIKYVLNYQCIHGRSAFEDTGDADDKRHLVRILLRDDDARSYMG